jgi:hypothetical protein
MAPLRDVTYGWNKMLIRREGRTVEPVLTVCFPESRTQSMDKRPGAALAHVTGAY